MSRPAGSATDGINELGSRLMQLISAAEVLNIILEVSI